MKWLCLIFLMVVTNRVAAEIRMNEVQVIGTHNSYHLAPEVGVMKMVSLFSKEAEAWNYSHKKLDQQLEAGVRQFELDVFADPEGGLYAGPEHPDLAAMKKPGAKVLHVPKLDFRSNYSSFVEALKAVKDWSGKNRDHVPVMILVELKDRKELPLGPTPVKFGRKEMEDLEAEILSVFEREELVTPDLVRGEALTLREVVIKKGWPKLKEVRGKVMFCLDNEGEHRDAYLKGNSSLQNRLIFVSVDRAHPAAAFMKRNDPVGGFEKIRKLVKQGFIVRTRADANLKEARANDLDRSKKALASGAQFVSTDFPEADPNMGSYVVRLPDGVIARSNPVSAAKGPAGEIE